MLKPVLTENNTPTMQEILQYWYSELTLEQIAQKLGITVGRLRTLRSRYRIARRDDIRTQNDNEASNPSPDEIAQETQKIRAGWTSAQEKARRFGPSTEPWRTPEYLYDSSTGIFSRME